MFRLEVIDYIDQTNQSLIARVPESGTAAIQFGAQLIVQQSQESIFFRDGRAMDAFGPGRYTLTTANLPILAQLLTLPFERSPFQACVYFIGKQTFIDQRWGTRQPITLRDPQFGIVRLRGYGKFAYRVIDGAMLLNSIVGTQGKFTTEEVINYLRDLIVAGLTDLLAKSGIGLLDMPSKMDELSAAARVKLGEKFAQYGLELTEFFISNISPPDEVQKAIDARSSMAVLGDLRSYSMYQTANAIAAAGQAGGAGNPMAIGLGMVLPSLVNANVNAMGSIPMASVIPNSPTPNLPRIDVSQAKASTPEQASTWIEQMAKQSQWVCERVDSGEYKLTVGLASARRQYVNVEVNRRDADGNLVLGIWSACGPFNPSAAMTVLRNNEQMVHAAFSTKKAGDSDLLVLRANLLADLTDAGELAKVISSIAWQADQVEQQLTGATDQF